MKICPECKASRWRTDWVLHYVQCLSCYVKICMFKFRRLEDKPE